MANEFAELGEQMNGRFREDAAELNFAEFEKVVRSRRSVRVFDGTPIPDEVMLRCLELAMLAPSSSNLQPWQFYRIQKGPVRTLVNEACLGQPAATTAAEIVVCVANPHCWRAHSLRMLKVFDGMATPPPPSAYGYYRRLMPLAMNQGPLGLFGFAKAIAVSLIGLFRSVPREPTSFADLRIWAVKSTALACENLMLALRASGFDSCPMEGFDSARIRRALGVPRGQKIVMAIGCGRRKPTDIYGPQIRFPFREFIHLRE